MTANNVIDKYIADQPGERTQVKLEQLRQVIKLVVPTAEECISYGMPAFKLHGLVVCFAAFKAHYSLFPCNSFTVTQFADVLKNYKTSKGTIQFSYDKPLPVSLVKKIVKARKKENEDKAKLNTKNKTK